MKRNKTLIILPIFLTILFCCSGCKKEENKWIPSVQGSHVEEMPYEEVGGNYSVEKYTDFKSFKKSELADYNFIRQRVAKEERYSAEFFKTRDLAVIKFNKPEKGIDYTVIDASVDGNSCTVKLLPIKQITEAEKTTYCCFLETEKDISAWNFRLVFEEEIIHKSNVSSYIAKDNSSYLFQGENTPVIFRISSTFGIDDFIEYDEVIDQYNYISRKFNSNYTKEDFDISDLLLVRVPSSDLEQCLAYVDNDTIKVVMVETNHYVDGWESAQDFSALIALLVPKDFNVNNTTVTHYIEYEDNIDNSAVLNKYTIAASTAITENLTRFDFK